MDAVDELFTRAHVPEHPHKQLVAFYEFHKANPAVLDFLVEEIQLRIDKGFPAFSHRSLWEYARWKLQAERGPGETFVMNDHTGIMYSRAVTILHPEFNGRCEFRRAEADRIFGTRLELCAGSRGYARRLEWSDGTALEDGWRPSTPHVVRAVRRKPDIHPR